MYGERARGDIDFWKCRAKGRRLKNEAVWNRGVVEFGSAVTIGASAQGKSDEIFGVRLRAAVAKGGFISDVALVMIRRGGRAAFELLIELFMLLAVVAAGVAVSVCVYQAVCVTPPATAPAVRP